MKEFKHWRLRTKIIVPAVGLAVVFSLGLGYLIFKQQTDLAVDQAKNTAEAISKQIRADRQIYTDKVIKKLRDNAVVGKDAVLKMGTMKDVNDASDKIHIPLPASFVHLTSDVVNAEHAHTVNLLSIWNINPDKAPHTPFENEALSFVANHYKDSKSSVEGSGDNAKLVYVTADVATADSCVTCHNDPAPTGWRKSPRTNFKLNDVMGGLVVTLPLASAFHAAKDNAIKLTASMIAAIALMLFLIALIQTRFVSRPLVGLEQAADRISTGELDQPVAVETEDEVGSLGKAFERMRVSLAAAMKAIEDKK